MGRGTNLFATKADIEAGLARFDASYPVAYALTGMFESSEPIILNQLLNVRDLAISLTGSHISGDAYLIVKAGTEIKPRRVERFDNTIRWAIDQLLNPQSIIFRPGGLYKHQAMICGHIDTVSSDEVAMELYRRFTRELTKGFTSIRGYKLGPEALKLFQAGMRFVTIQIDSPSAYDLQA